ncbi:MAG TPA: ABC transporter permease [Puia sp.]|uniref:ABC transporter permease n=1 Tax=Puia sp. TaxID=2045100 RepID=UPI002C25E570|nr:ABC transporter permease [Puia sp.]HVU94093.1 ABC transporter permease [Puia sp.]
MIRNLQIVGLALGLATCIFIGLFVADELGYDRYNTKADRIFRVVADFHVNGNSLNDVVTPSPMAAALVRDFPAIENAVRIRSYKRDITVQVEHQVFPQSGAVRADSTLFAVFTLPMVAGDPRTALAAPNTVVLSATAAKRYFNTTDVIGRTLRIDDDTVLCKITGVIRDIPAQSHFHFQLIRSLQNTRQDWTNFFSPTYILVRPGTPTAEIDRMLEQTVKKYVYPQVQNEMHNTVADLRQKGDYFRFYSMPLTRIHLHSNLGQEFEANGDIRYVVLFTTVGALILIVAIINFVLLSTARNLRRLKAVGVRKILGSGRRRLIVRFLKESTGLAAIAMVIAIGLVVLLLPVFNQFAGKSFTRSSLLTPWTIPAVILGTTLAGFIAGMGPAWTLSRVDPLTILRNQPAAGIQKGTLRTILLVFQFGVAIMLIIGTGVIESQLSYVRHRNLGYTRQQVVTIKDTRSLGDQVWSFANETRKLPGVINATVSGFRPDKKIVYRGFLKFPDGSLTSTVLLEDWQVDADYLPTLDMHLAAGRNFSPQLSTDSGCILINETAARYLGYTHPLQERLYSFRDSIGYRIIGVVKDFNTGSLHNPIEPVVLRLARDGSAVTYRLSPQNIAGTLQLIRKKYEAMANGYPFAYSFLDEDFNRLYAADQRTGSLFTVFSILALVIAAIGMIGLVTSATEQRTRELGIRRVLGARTIHLAGLLLKDYGLAIAIAITIALPAGAWTMHNWLQGFAYRTGLHPEIFIAAPLCALTLAITIVGGKAVKATSVNLTETLRVE